MIDLSRPLLIAHVVHRFDIGGLENGEEDAMVLKDGEIQARVKLFAIYTGPHVRSATN